MSHQKKRKLLTGDSDSDDETEYKVYSSAAIKESFPVYDTKVKHACCPQRIGQISPEPFARATKDALRLLSGKFAWRNFVQKQNAANTSDSGQYDQMFLEGAYRRKLEAGWQKSVVQKAARCIADAVRPKDEDATYRKLEEYRHVMHSSRLHAGPAVGRPHSLPPLESPSPPNTAAQGIASSLLLLNDEMLQHEAHAIMYQQHAEARPSPTPSPLLQEVSSVLRHRSLSPLSKVLTSLKSNA